MADKGADIRYSDGVELKNVNIRQSEGKGFSIANCRNVKLEGCTDAAGNRPDVFQYRNENVEMK